MYSNLPIDTNLFLEERKVVEELQAELSILNAANDFERYQSLSHTLAQKSFNVALSHDNTGMSGIINANFSLYHFELAIKFYTLASDLGLPIAKHNLAYMYLKGYGTPINYIEAKKLYEQAIDLGYILSRVGLGYVYLSSDKPGDFQRAVELFTDAARAGVGAGYYNLAALHKLGKIGEAVNYPKAWELFEEAALCGLEEEAEKALNALSKVYAPPYAKPGGKSYIPLQKISTKPEAYPPIDPPFQSIPS